MKRLICLSIIVCSLLFGCLVSVYAEDNSTEKVIHKAEFEGNGSSLADLFSGSTTSVNNLHLYNVGKDLFFNAGAYWGTGVVTFTVGLTMTLNKETYNSTECYTMQGPFANNGGQGQGNYVGIVVKPNTKEDGVYWDRSKSAYKDNPAAYWIFEAVEGFVNTYTIKSADNSYYLKGNAQVMPEVLTTKKIYNGVTYTTTSPADVSDETEKSYYYWKIVTETDLTNDFENTYNKTNPSNATFILRAQNFNRQNKYDYVTSGEGWHISNLTHGGNTSKAGGYSYYVKTTDTSFTGKVEESYGMFFAGEIKGAVTLKSDTETKVYQTITAPEKGWYRLDCKGMYYNDANPDECNAVLYATVSGTDTSKGNTSQNSYVDLLPKKQWEITTSDEYNNHIIDDIKEAGEAFFYGYYLNSLLVYVPEDNKELEIGIKITKDLGENDFVWFDDFEFGYLGTEMLLNEDHETFESYDKTEYKNRVLILKKKMTVGKWNAIILPVDLNKEQVYTAFFPNTEIAYLESIENNNTICFKKKDISQANDKDIVLEAGKCYIIKPRFEGKTDTYNALKGSGEQEDVNGDYFLIDRISLQKNTISNTKDITDETPISGDTPITPDNPFGSECKISIHGCYQKVTVPANAYVFNGGNMYHLTSAYNMKGYRCWLEDEHQMGETGARHAISFSINGVNDDTSDIEGIFVNGEINGQNNTLYNIWGQRVTRISHPGIYITGGKKVTIK